MTGRRHQLRKHMAGLSHPILGDRKYRSQSQAGSSGLRGLYLWAAELELTHPISGAAMHVKHGPPAKFARILDREQVTQVSLHAFAKMNQLWPVAMSRNKLSLGLHVE